MSKTEEQDRENIAVEIKKELVPLTLDLAVKYNEMATLKGDRDPDSRKGINRRKELYLILQQGKFYSPEWSDVIIGEDEIERRIDGGHSSRVLVELKTDEFPKGLMATLRHFRAKDVHSATMLYEQFNPRFSTRTPDDLVKNRKGLVEKLDAVSNSSVTQSTRGICCHLRLNNPIETFNYLDYINDEEANFIKWASHYTGSRLFKKTAVMAAMYATWTFDREAAEEFWPMVLDEESDPPQPLRMLHNLLLLMSVPGGKESKFSARKTYVKCLHAWNAWPDDTTTLSYYRGGPLPKLK